MDSNVGTRLGTEQLFVPPAVREALVARATLAQAALPPPREGVAFRVFWGPAAAMTSGSGELAFADLHATDHLVVGRHSACDVRLGAPEIALRHLLLRVRLAGPGGAPSSAPSSAPSLVVQDLATSFGFLAGMGTSFLRAAVIEGATILVVASEALVVLPTTTHDASDESALRPRVLDADPARAQPIARELSELAVRTQVQSIWRTQVHPIAPPLPVEVLPAREAPWARLALRGPEGRVVVEVSEDDLTSLVLLGRYPRCRRGELSPFSTSVSRVHAAVVRDADAILVLDLASTNGIATRIGETRHEELRAIRVTSRASIELGSRADRLDVEILRTPA